MDDFEKKQSVCLTLKKVFDMKMKTGHDMRKAFIDESEFLKVFYFLKGQKLYVIDINSKKIEECEFTRGKEVIFISGNMTNEFLIIVLKNGKIYALDTNRNVKFFKNLVVNSNLIESKESMDNFKMFCSHGLDKLVIANDNFITIWYRSDLSLEKNSSINSLNTIKTVKAKRNSFSGMIKKPEIEEIYGKFYSISLENERSLILRNQNLKGSFFESVVATFGNNYFLGSFGKIVYVIFTSTEISNSYKLILTEYTFKYEKSDRQRKNLSPDDSLDILKNIEKRSLYSYFTYSKELSKENLQYTQGKERILMKFNCSGNMLAILINSQHAINSFITVYYTETSKFSSLKLFDLWTKIKAPKNEASKIFIWVEDLDFICNDLFIVLVFSQGYFLILNLDFSIMTYIDISNSTVPSMGSNIEIFTCPTYIYNQKLKLSDKLQLIASKKRSDYFAIYNKDFCICYLTNSKNYESRMLMTSAGDTFVDFLYLVKYYQLYPNESDSGLLFDKIHNFMVKFFKELYSPETEQTMPNEQVGHIFNIFVKFIRIFRSIDLVHETNLTILSYLIGVTNDFFYHLINYKEIWLAYLFIEVCDNYLLKNLRIKISKKKIVDDPLIKSQISHYLFNPYHLQNPSLKCFNKINNKVLHSRLRLILLFFALIEFRNNQALNINVLYFILAKNCIEKLKRNNMLDDVQTIVKVIIRNWKYLKNENIRAGGEEYILSGLTMNYKTEILSHLIFTKNSRDDIKFEFFSDFLPLEGLSDFFDLHETYCRGDEESLVNEYNYINNIGIIQRWVLFFTNYFYSFMFEDIKNYTTNHIKQTLLQNKKIENISPEETNLSALIYFNLSFFFLTLNNHMKAFLKFFSNMENYESFNNFNKTQMPFISPVDVPFIIFEFYSIEDNKFRKNFPHEISQHLEGLIFNYSKCFNFSLNDTFDFLDFLYDLNFKCISKDQDEAKIISENRIQNYISTAFTFYLFVVHKFNLLHLLESEANFLLLLLENLNNQFKQELYSLLFVICNGHLRFFLHKESQSKLNIVFTRNLEIILYFLKTLFYKLLREETFCVRKKIYEYIQISPNILRPYLLEGAYFYEYKNFNKFIKHKLLDHKNLLNIRNYLNITNKKLPNIFEDLLSSSGQTALFDTIFLNEDDLINNGNKKQIHSNFVIAVDNMIKLSKLGKNRLLYLESNIEDIRKAIFNLLDEKKSDEVLNIEFVSSVIDKVINGNYESLKKEFKFNNNEYKIKLTRSIKFSYFKSLHLLNLLYVKYKSFFALNPQKETLLYLKVVAYSLVFINDGIDDMNHAVYILNFLSNLKLRDIRENEKLVIYDIINYLALVFIKKGKKLKNHSLFLKFEDNIVREDKFLEEKLKSLFIEEIPRIEILYENLSFLTSKNLKNSFVLFFCDFYWENMTQVLNAMDTYLGKEQNQGVMSQPRRTYIKLAESFYELTGLPSKNFIEFNENWSLSTDESLFNFIVCDDYEESLSPDPYSNLVMNRRQKYGCDTPRKSTKLNPGYTPSENLNDSNRSITIREESEKIEKQKIVIKAKRNPALPPKGKKKQINNNGIQGVEEDKSYNKSVNTILKKEGNESDNVSSNTIIKNINKTPISKEVGNTCKESNTCKVEKMISVILKCLWNQFKIGVFYKFKEEAHKNELEEIKFFNVKPQEGKYDVLVLKEKYVASKDVEYRSARGSNGNCLLQNSSYISENKSIHKRNESLGSNASNSEKNILNIKAFDIININKFRSGQADKSAILKDLLNTKSRKEMQNTVKNKIREIQEKLQVYEEMAMSLGKEFTNAFSK